VFDQGVRAVLGQDHNIEQTGIDAVRQRKIDDPVLAGKRDCRLGALGGQRAKARPLPTSQDHCASFHGFHLLGFSPVKLMQNTTVQHKFYTKIELEISLIPGDTKLFSPEKFIDIYTSSTASRL
jgi:hypothetical protein